MSNTVLKLEKIQEFINDNNLSKREFCKKCSVTVYMFNKILEGYVDFDINILLKIAKLMKVEIVDLINENYKYVRLVKQKSKR